MVIKCIVVMYHLHVYFVSDISLLLDIHGASSTLEASIFVFTLSVVLPTEGAAADLLES